MASLGQFCHIVLMGENMSVAITQVFRLVQCVSESASETAVRASVKRRISEFNGKCAWSEFSTGISFDGLKEAAM